MEAHERRIAIWRSLCCHRLVTVAHLAAEYGVSIRTITNDVQILSITHPIETVRGRYHGGIKIPDWYKPNPNVCSPAQLDFLLRVKANTTGNDLIIIESIIDQFGK